MILQQKVEKKNKSFFTCLKCGELLSEDSFLSTKSLFFPNGKITICKDCILKILKSEEYSWDIINRFCQYMDIPFLPKKFEELKKINGEEAFFVYANLMQKDKYENLHWQNYYKRFKKLEEEGRIVDELPKFKDKEIKELKKKWGSNYSEDELYYLENLLQGLLSTQNMFGALQDDQALKLCKISLSIDVAIQNGLDFEKLLSSYDRLVKIAGFTPKNVKNINDFESVGELVKWLEKKGFKNKFYDNVTRDIVDETMKNIQVYNQKLYTNESGIGEEITRRIENLKTAKEMENHYDTNVEYDLEEYDNQGYEELINNEEFEIDLGDG